ncbi:beta-ketoacyl synthase N-terminal-like domain-containing protein [Amycolatopsis sp.]|jgi:3-oxoacyl-[acyl-carrier-protein] synthase II|uniref:beta-ketoacyl synthase N-terminal-like domain-containing protein n=1 Tax=Amycolatopsis sp. TaxID=37632 RepID=UPI002E16CFE3
MQHHTNICGIGAVTPYGWGRDRLWDGLVSGAPSATSVAGYGAGPADPGWVGLVPDGGRPEDGSRFARAMLAAVREAITDAKARGWRPGRKVGVLHGAVLHDTESWHDYHRQDTRWSRRDFISLMPSTPMFSLMQEHGFHGPTMDLSSMCASGNAALITAKMWLDDGRADDVIVVTTDLSGLPAIVRSFVDAGVAVTDLHPFDACRPFQTGSRGFVFAEAAVAFVVTRSDVDSYALVLGGEMGHEAHHAIGLATDSAQAVSVVTDALGRAGVAPGAVRYLNAHGPGTRQCDATESAILERLPAAQVYSFKPSTGHTQCAASLVEIAGTCLGWQHNLIPAPNQVAEGHPRLLPGATTPEPGIVVKTSVGMGGSVAAVVLENAAG